LLCGENFRDLGLEVGEHGKLGRGEAKHTQKSKRMSNSTLIRPALKIRVQAPELVFYRVKITGGDQRPYSQPVPNKGADLRDMRPNP
jgi:hypothetical protein